MSLDIKRLEVQLVNVKAARMANELRIAEFLEVIEKLKKDIQISMDRENDLEKQISGKRE